MRYLIPRVVLAALGIAVSCVVFGQPGLSGASPGSFGDQGQQQGNGIFGSTTGSQRETTLAGTWTLEFEVTFDSLNPRYTGDRVTLRADVTVIGVEVSGRFRNPAEGEFSCTVYEGSDRCESGRLLVVWPGERVRQSADFEFVVDAIDGRRAKGEANMVNVQDGAIRNYTVHMTKR